MRKTIETEQFICGFFEKYRPLSNYDETTFKLFDINFKSSEHAFHYFKTSDEEWKQKILNAETPSEAKKLGRICPIRENWDEVKIKVMYGILCNKFSQNKELKELLMSTGYKYLEETNDWNDTFWGVCNGKGENNLGKCLMRVREEIRWSKLV